MKLIAILIRFTIIDVKIPNKKASHWEKWLAFAHLSIKIDRYKHKDGAQHDK